MSNELRQHKRSDTIKWVAIFLIAILLMAFVITLWSKGFKTINPYCWGDNHTYDNDGVCINCGAVKSAKADSNGGMLLDDSVVGNGIMLLSTTIPVEQYGDYGIMPIAESAQQLTATITPSNADNTKVDWTIAWKNPSSSWAKGKTVTNYVTVKATSDGALTANVSCLKDFGEQIVIKCTSRENPTAQAICTVDYVQKITGFTFNMPLIDDFEIDFSYQFDTSEYTIKSNLSVELIDSQNVPVQRVGLRLNPALSAAYYSAIESAAGFSSYTTSLWEQGRPTVSISGNKIIVTPVSDSDFVGISNIPLLDAFLHFNAKYLDEYIPDRGMAIDMFLEMLRSSDYSHHVEFGVRYKAVYNGVTYSSGEEIIHGKFDVDAFSATVRSISLPATLTF